MKHYARRAAGRKRRKWKFGLMRIEGMVLRCWPAIVALVLVAFPAKANDADNLARTPRELGVLVGRAIISGDPATLNGVLPSFNLYMKAFRMAATIDRTSEDEMVKYYGRVIGKLREEVANLPADLQRYGFNVKEVFSVNVSSEEHGGWTSDVTVTMTHRDGSTFRFVLDECVEDEGLWYFYDIDPGGVVRISK